MYDLLNMYKSYKASLFICCTKSNSGVYIHPNVMEKFLVCISDILYDLSLLRSDDTEGNMDGPINNTTISIFIDAELDSLAKVF